MTLPCPIERPSYAVRVYAKHEHPPVPHLVPALTCDLETSWAPGVLGIKAPGSEGRGPITKPFTHIASTAIA